MATDVAQTALTAWTATNGVKSISFVPALGSGGTLVANNLSLTSALYASGGVQFHYTADARIGIV